MCGANSYRPVIARDEAGATRPSGLYQCSGCSVVFADPRAWREGGEDDLLDWTPTITPLRPVAAIPSESETAEPKVLPGS
jgi:hypothetical protein